MVESWLVVEPQISTGRVRNIYCGALLPAVKLTKLERLSLHPYDFQNFRIKIVNQSKSKNRLAEPGLFQYNTENEVDRSSP